MKTTGFHAEITDLSTLRSRYTNLPQELTLWGSFDNFEQVNIPGLSAKVFLLTYYDEIKAGLIFYEKTYLKVIKIGYSPNPYHFVTYGHVYLQKQDSQRAQEQLLEKFVSSLNEMIAKEKFQSFKIAFPPSHLDMREFSWSGWQAEPRYTYLLEMEILAKQGLSQYVGKKIRNLIKDTKQNLIIKPITPDEMYLCYKETYARQGNKPAKSKEYIQKLQHIPNVMVLGAFAGTELTAGIAICEDGNTASFLTSGARNAHYNSNGVLHLLYSYFESLLNNNQKQIRYFDFIGANNRKVAHFKSNFNPSLIQYFTVQKKSTIITLLEKLLFKH